MTVMRYFVRDEAPSQARHWVPAVDIYETEGHDVVIKAELPEMAREDIDVTVDHQTLTIKGTRKAPADVPEDRYRRVERRYGTLQPVVHAAEHGGHHQGQRRLQERRPDGEAAVQGGGQAADDHRRRRRLSQGGQSRKHGAAGAACPCYSDGMAMAEIERDPRDPLPGGGPAAPRPKAPPIESRFLFVDVAALRAKQLRRGALLRLDDDAESRPEPALQVRAAGDGRGEARPGGLRRPQGTRPASPA